MNEAQNVFNFRFFYLILVLFYFHVFDFISVKARGTEIRTCVFFFCKPHINVIRYILLNKELYTR